MVFFDFDEDKTGDMRLAGNAWLYLAVTVPLTVTVFFVWWLWMRWSVRGAVKTRLKSPKTFDYAPKSEAGMVGREEWVE